MVKNENPRSLSATAMNIRYTIIRRFSEMANKIPHAIDMAIGDARPPVFETPRHIKEAAKKALDEGFTYYPPPAGFPELKEAIAEKLKRENNLEVNPDKEIVVTVGATEGLFCGILATVEPGDEVVIPDPCHDIYEPIVRMAGGVPVRIPLREEEGFAVKGENLKKAISSRTKAIWFCNPSSPSGRVMSSEELEQIGEVAREGGIYVLMDEPYEKFVYDGKKHVSLASLPGMQPYTITAYTLSKSYAMTGWRVGYVVASEAVTQLITKIHRNTVSGVNTIAQKAGVVALRGDQNCVRTFVDTLDESRRILVDGLNRIKGISCWQPSGTFYCYPNISGLGMKSMEFAEFLVKEAKVMVVPGDNWGLYRKDEYVRISYSHPKSVIEDALERIEKAVRFLA